MLHFYKNTLPFSYTSVVDFFHNGFMNHHHQFIFKFIIFIHRVNLKMITTCKKQYQKGVFKEMLCVNVWICWQVLHQAAPLPPNKIWRRSCNTAQPHPKFKLERNWYILTQIIAQKGIFILSCWILWSVEGLGRNGQAIQPAHLIETSYCSCHNKYQLYLEEFCGQLDLFYCSVEIMFPKL